ncbi:MAG: hypothetical protein AAF985_25245, partial [Bacteroidota bacterium]
ILKHFKLLDKSLPGKEKLQSYQNFRQELLAFKQQRASPISIDELLIWLKAKIERKPLKVVYQSWLADNDHLES